MPIRTQDFKRHLLCLLFVCISGWLPSQIASGDIENYIGAIIDNAPGSSGDNYTEPNSTQLTSWGTLLDFLFAEDLTNARSNANAMNYQITEFTDTSLIPNQIFYVLEEQNPSSNYWGTYIFSKTPARNNLILQAPHSKFDTNTGKQAVYCFKNTLARALFINGTHRCNSNALSSCSGTTSVCGVSSSYSISDQAHNTNSMFQKTTENLLSNVSNSVFIQLHGFAKQISDPYVILSNGTRDTPSIDYAILLKDALLLEDNSLTFELAHINMAWTRLVGFTNTQGRLINNSLAPCNTDAVSTSGRFLHVEQEKSKLRDDENDWAKMSNALLNVFPSTLSLEGQNLGKLISVAPNPSQGEIFVKGLGIQEIGVYNLYGQKIMVFKNSVDESIKIDLNYKSKGLYLLKIATENGSISKKIILQ